jgi:AraC-like DNA-binding protein
MDARVRLTLKLIEEHKAPAQFCLSETSKMMGLSEPYLLRLFHHEVGKTLRQHLLESRMARAARLLKQHFRPIKQIASECGYSDLSNFYRDFRRVYMLTPKELRLKELTAIAEASSQQPPAAA